MGSAATLVLLDLVVRRVPSGSRRWIEGCSTMLRPGAADPKPFVSLYAATARLLGQDPLRLVPTELARVRGARLETLLEGWRVDDLGRTVLLLAAARRFAPCALAELVETCYRVSDANAGESLLRVLPLLGLDRLLIAR